MDLEELKEIINRNAESYESDKKIMLDQVLKIHLESH